MKQSEDEIEKDLEEHGLEVEKELVLKPYPTEHANRLNTPDKYERFRRDNDAFGEGVDAIYGVTGDGTVELQAIRFNADKFSPAEARAWLKEHDYPDNLEEASGEEEKKEEVVEEKKEEVVEEKKEEVVEEKARGEGQGVGGPRQGDGGTDTCVCPECGKETAHDRGTPCSEQKCPECGATMQGKQAEKQAEEVTTTTTTLPEEKKEIKQIKQIEVKTIAYRVIREGGYQLTDKDKNTVKDILNGKIA